MFNRHSQQVEDWYVDKGYLAQGVMKNFLQKFTPVRNLKEWYPEAKEPVWHSACAAASAGTGGRAGVYAVQSEVE